MKKIILLLSIIFLLIISLVAADNYGEEIYVSSIYSATITILTKNTTTIQNYPYSNFLNFGVIALFTISITSTIIKNFIKKK